MMRKKQRDGGAYSARGCGAAEAASGAALAEARSSVPGRPGRGSPESPPNTKSARVRCGRMRAVGVVREMCVLG